MQFTRGLLEELAHRVLSGSISECTFRRAGEGLQIDLSRDAKDAAPAVTMRVRVSSVLIHGASAPRADFTLDTLLREWDQQDLPPLPAVEKP